MKNVLLLSLLFSTVAIGQTQEWKKNLNEAFKEASSSGKNVLLFFSVSHDCERCDLLDKKVLQSDEFMEYAKDKYILVKQDYRTDNPENLEESLLVVEKYNKDGFFPLVVSINRNAKVLGQIGTYNNESAREYVAKLESIKRS
jgi:thioredoxin-related protein